MTCFRRWWNSLSRMEMNLLNGNLKNNESKEKEKEHSVDIEFKMWESCKIRERDFSPERDPEQESFKEEVDAKVETGVSHDQINGLPSSAKNLDNGTSSPSKQQQH
ncbi:putative WEB family protein [Camellia lanceoleosa]|uniref:WEB family protein n=1 Tax=Camellia lanceoleosa TaxID=1840588 RepID=A0ACC0H2V4_9ERIC|nr:putative WEB family protein [Camellia lanceoleosa]